MGEQERSGAGPEASEAERTLAPDSTELSKLEVGLQQATKELIISKENEGYSQTGGLCPALLLPTPGRSPGICSLCHHPPVACLFINTVLGTTVPRNLQRPGFGGRGGV